jgi:TonB family protein
MYRMLRMLLFIGLLFCELFHQPATLYPQEPAEIFGYQAVRFEHSPGFFHYAALCRTPTEFSAQIPPNKLPKEVTESAVCWYVKASRIRSAGKDDATPESDGKLVVSAHHVRFMPHNPQFADLYADLQPERLELQHQPGDAYATLGGEDFAFKFRFSKLCLSCPPGTPIAPGFKPALLDQEFGLLDESLRNFQSGSKKIYQLSSGAPVESQPRTPVAASGGSARMRASVQPGPAAAPGPSAAAVSNSAAITGAKPGATTPKTAPKTAPVAASDDPVKTPDAPETEPTRPVAKTVKVPAGTVAGMLVKKVEPVYPLEAKVARLEGTVVLRAIIDTTGEVAAVGAISGPPLLKSAAVEAVRQWEFRPYAVNGEPVEVDTTIQVIFSLDGSPQQESRAPKLP